VVLGPWSFGVDHSFVSAGKLLIFQSSYGQFNTIQGPWVKVNATFEHDPLTMDG
jgi:hypothetical protein